MGADITVNWDSIEAKAGKSTEKKVKSKVKMTAKQIAKEFVKIMNEEIQASLGTITQPEIDRIMENALTWTGSSQVGVHYKQEHGVDFGFDLYFDFAGDTKLISLSPRKYVRDAVALFNNGYASNNIDPEHKIKGYWKGHYLELGPYSQAGAHFIGRAIERFKEWAASNGWVVTYSVNPIYSTEK